MELQLYHKLLSCLKIIQPIVFITIFSITGANAQIIKIPANPESGYFWPYYLSVPESVDNVSTLLVIPNNTGTTDDDPAVHDTAAYSTANNSTYFAEEIRSPLLVPTFPRFHTNWQLYTHALDRDSLLTDIEDLERIDLQLIAMIEDSKKRLSSMGIYIEKKVLMMGFSAAAQFASRFSIIHPNRIKAAAIGAPGYPIVPTSSWQGEDLRFHVGTSDLYSLTGREFDLSSFKYIPLYFYVGGLDTNDPVDYLDGFDPQDQDLINNLFGDTTVGRWPNVQNVYETLGCNSIFTIYQGVGHSITPEMINDVKSFLIKNKTIEPDISVEPLSNNFVTEKESYSEKELTIKNEGSATLNVAAIYLLGDTNEFHIVDDINNFSLGLGNSHNLTIKFEPTTFGQHNTTLRIISNDPDHPQLDTVLTGVTKGTVMPIIKLLLSND